MWKYGIIDAGLLSSGVDWVIPTNSEVISKGDENDEEELWGCDCMYVDWRLLD